MSFFAYRAIGANAAVVSGDLEAGSRKEALLTLDRRGLQPIEVSEKKGEGAAGGPALSFSFARKKVSHVALGNFTRQLSSLLTAGIPLSRALQIVCREASSPAAAKQWKEIHDRVIEGMALADAMALAPQTFPRVYVAMVRSGEAGGFLDVSLTQIADFQRLDRELKSRALSALIYPCVLGVLAVCVVFFLMVFFIPRFQGIFADFGASLPALTKAIMAVSDIMTRYAVAVVVVVAGAIYGSRMWIQSDQGRRTYERWILKMPVVGPLAARFAMVRFTRMLGTLSGAGVPLISALRVARASLGNQTLVDAVETAIEQVQQGLSLSESLAGCPMLFPGSVLEMIAVAEETGRLDEELVRLAELTEADLDRNLRIAVALVEPAMLFIMAGVIGTVVVGMLLPIFSLQDYIN